MFVLATTFPTNRNRLSQQLTDGASHRYNYRLCRNAWSSTFRARPASTASPCCGRQTALGQSARCRPEPGHCRGCQRSQTLYPATDRRQPKRRTVGAGAELLRPRFAGAAFSRLGNPALRPVFAAPGHHLPAHRQPVPLAGTGPRRASGADHHGPASPGADQVPTGQQPGAGCRPEARRGANAHAPGSQRLSLRRHGV